ncbi:MAG: Eco57I restriction-modification methylase domain-containing protein [Caldilineales bacterium]
MIGNPPYIRMETFKELKEYLKALRKVMTSDQIFTPISSNVLIRANQVLGRFGMIISNKFYYAAKYGRPLRQYLHQNTAIHRVVDFAGLPVFQGATVRTIVLLTIHEQENDQSILYWNR